MMMRKGKERNEQLVRRGRFYSKVQLLDHSQTCDAHSFTIQDSSTITVTAWNSSTITSTSGHSASSSADNHIEKASNNPRRCQVMPIHSIQVKLLAHHSNNHSQYKHIMYIHPSFTSTPLSNNASTQTTQPGRFILGGRKACLFLLDQPSIFLLIPYVFLDVPTSETVVL